MTVLQAISETQCRAIVRERSGGRCEIAIPGVCRGRAESFSHRIRRGRGGLWQPSNGLDACGSGTTGCHGWVNGRPVLAEAAGLDYLPAGSQSWPAWCEPYGWYRSWWHPRDDGTWTECARLASWWLHPSSEVLPEYRGHGVYDASPWDAETWNDLVVCERPDSNREQQRAHASLCDGLGTCAA